MEWFSSKLLYCVIIGLFYHSFLFGLGVKFNNNSNKVHHFRNFSKILGHRLNIQLFINYELPLLVLYYSKKTN